MSKERNGPLTGPEAPAKRKPDAELAVMSRIMRILAGLAPDARQRVVAWLHGREQQTARGVAAPERAGP
jgi:hypothetical protein